MEPSLWVLGAVGLAIAVIVGVRWVAHRGTRWITEPVDLIDPDDPDARCERGRRIDFAAHVCARYGVHVLASPADRTAAAHICRVMLVELKRQAREVLASGAEATEEA